MKLSWRRRLGVYTGLAVLSLAILSFGQGDAAFAATQTITGMFPQVACDANVNGTHIVQKQDITYGFLVPDQVAPSSVFTVTFPGGSALLPNTSNGLTITNYSNLSLTYQVQGGGTFVPGSIVNPGTAVLDPTAAGANQNIVQSASLTATDKYTSGNPGPFVPGTLTTPTITVDVQAPASGNVTFNAFQLTTTVKLNNAFNAAVVCAIPTTTLATVPVVAGVSSTTAASSSTTAASSSTTAASSSTTAASSSTTAASSTTVASTSTTAATTTTLPPTSTTAATTTTTAATTTTTAATTTTTAATTTTTAATTTTTIGEQGSTTTTLPPVEQVKIHGSSSNVNNCATTLRPEISLVPDGTSVVEVAMATDASPQPHLGDPISLTNTTVTVKVPPDLLITGYNFGILVNGQVIPATLDLTVAGSNTTQGTHRYPLIHSNAKLVMHDPDGEPNTGDETADPLTVTTKLPNTNWNPANATLPVFFTQKSAVIKAVVPIGDVNYTSTQDCKVAHPASFVALSPNGVDPPTTLGATGTTVTPTTVGTTADPGTLPRTGANAVLFLVIGAICLDLGIVAIAGTRRRAQHALRR